MFWSTLRSTCLALMSVGLLTPAFGQGRVYQELHIPEALEGTHFELRLHNASKSFWKGAITQTYAYNKESFWGPTLIFNQGDLIHVDIKNELGEPTTNHWHGFHIPAAVDGGPHQIIPPGATWSPSFKVLNQAGTYWYHPHAHTTTQKQLTMGAGGLIIIRDKEESKLKLPRTYGVDDIPLVFSSRRFFKNDQFSYLGDNDKYGDYLLANGTLDAQKTLPAQFVRLRILNAEIERGYNIGLSDNRTFFLIGTDDGLVNKPVPLKRMKLMAGERAEILVDLSKDRPGSALDLMSFNSGQSFGYPGAEPGSGRPNGGYLNNIDFRLLHVNVGTRTSQAITELPVVLSANQYWTEAQVTQRRTVSINGGRPTFFFDNAAYDMHAKNQVVKLGAVEEWTVLNNQIFGHSFHIHDVKFNIVSRSDGPVEAWEQGWKDTVYVHRGESVKFIAKFEDFASETSPYMYHCHMSNHEDGGLMGQFFVVKDPTAVSFRLKINHPVTTAMKLAADTSVGKFAPNKEALDIEGKPVSLSSPKRPVILFFIEKDCPCSRDAAPFFNQLQAQLGAKADLIGIINASSGDAHTWVKASKSQFRILPDPKLNLIKGFGATHSVFTTVLSRSGRVEQTYPGYSGDMLRQLEKRFGVQVQRFKGAPRSLTAGCPFDLGNLASAL